MVIAGKSAFPAIAVSGNNIHVVWRDFTPGNPDILYRRSLDNGGTFPNVIKNLSGNAGLSTAPSIAVSGNNVHVVWEDNTPGNSDISRQHGGTFPNVIKNLSGNIGSSFNPAIAVSGNNVHVVWEDDTPGIFDILYRRSLDNGSTFPAVIKNFSSNATSSAIPEIAISGNNVYVVWVDNPITDFEVLYRTSANNGDTFPAVSTNLSTNEGNSFSPTIAVS